MPQLSTAPLDRMAALTLAGLRSCVGGLYSIGTERPFLVVAMCDEGAALALRDLPRVAYCDGPAG
eukprot:8220790-Alexandrium_andersonii.AAC.1